MAIAKLVIGERYMPEAVDRNDMLGSFVRHELEQKEAEDESLVQIIVGSDTTATVLRTVTVHVVTNPTIYRRLQVEIDSVVAKQLFSSPITGAEAKELPLPQACIKEGFHMWPPISGIMPRIGDVVCGIRIPAGTNVAWSARQSFATRVFSMSVGAVNTHGSWWVEILGPQLRMGSCG